MNHDEHNPNVEQSWIVLDDRGWGASRPPTASPTRPSSQLRSVREEEEEEGEISRRIGMDRDVREALELAERSLELAGSAEEFLARSPRVNSSDESMHEGAAGSIWAEGLLEDRYNGRAPPTVRRTVAITTDSEHVAFKNIRLISADDDSSQSSSNALVVDEVSVKSMSDEEPAQVSNPAKHEYTAASNPDHQHETEKGVFEWILGLQVSTNVLPLVLSHTVALLAGFYFGLRRSSTCSPSSQASGSSVSSISN